MADAPGPDVPPREREHDHLLGTTWRRRTTGAVFELVMDVGAPFGCTMFRVDVDGTALGDESVEAGDGVWLREHYEQVERRWVPVDRG